MSDDQAQSNPQENQAAVQNAAAGSLGGGASLEQVRELLFGEQSRDVTQRLEQLEGRFESRVAEIQEEAKQHVDTLTKYLKTELAGLIEKLGTQREERAAIFQQLTDQINGINETYDEKLQAFEERIGSVETDTREELETRSKTMSEEIQHRVNDLAQVVALETTQLRDGCVDRHSLSTMLADLAMGLVAQPESAEETEFFEVPQDSDVESAFFEVPQDPAAEAEFFDVAKE